VNAGCTQAAGILTSSAHLLLRLDVAKAVCHSFLQT
jgi:hypothetical protein